ncbi:acyl carrier protein [Cryptosporangium arvum]|uniref:Phosphopantetheine-binding protein n=1 Tax=Cryptosporangium arvum DSM 44712 TaxID=927661 RepID=A0A011AJD1_9ACTN|nr:acyl carrier protein [Cryptosporangium arvum]EXG82126.1 phosphopantetheine-binding protein [Cryptosporangium arvum DSM 44712]
MHEEVRAVLRTVPKLAGVVDTLPVDADLWAAGMDSLTSVHVMVRLEDHFDLQFSEDALTRDTFGSIQAIAAAVSAVVASREGVTR